MYTMPSVSIAASMIRPFIPSLHPLHSTVDSSTQLPVTKAGVATVKANVDFVLLADSVAYHRQIHGSDEEVLSFPGNPGSLHCTPVGVRESPSVVHMPPTPHRRETYPFHDAPKVVLSQDVQQLNHAANIVRTYNMLVLQRDVIKESLQDFTDFLNLPADTELTRCFGHLREYAGRAADIQIVEDEGEPKRMTLDEVSLQNLPEKFQNARTRFNSVLSNSFIFMREKDIWIDDIKSNLEEMVGLRDDQLQTRATQSVYKQLREIPSYIEDFAVEVERLLDDIDIAKYNLEKRGVTGIIQLQLN